MSPRKPPQHRKPPSKIVKTQQALEFAPPTRPGTPAFGLPAGQADANDDAEIAYSQAMRTLVARRQAAADARAVEQVVASLVDQVSHAALLERSASARATAQAAIARSQALRRKIQTRPAQVSVVPSLPRGSWNEKAAARLHGLRCEFVLDLLWRLPLSAQNNLIDRRTEAALVMWRLLEAPTLRAAQQETRVQVREFTKEEYAAEQGLVAGSPPPSPTHTGSDGDLDSDEDSASDQSASISPEESESEEWENLVPASIQDLVNYFVGKQKSSEFNVYTQERLAHFEQAFAAGTDFEGWKKAAPTSGHAAVLFFFGAMFQNQTYFNLVAKLTKEDFDYLRANQRNFAELIAGWRDGFAPSSAP